MRVKRFWLFQSPFDSGYVNVPDDFNNNPSLFHLNLWNYLGSNFMSYYGEPLDNKRLVVPRNYRISVTIRFPYTPIFERDVAKYNYIIFDENDNGDVDDNSMYYFINNYTINNNTDDFSVTFECVKDVWVSNYTYICSNANIRASIIRKHQRWRVGRIDDLYTLDVPDGIVYSSHEMGSKEGLNYNYADTKYDVLYMRIQLDTTKRYFIVDDDGEGEAVSLPYSNIEYGSLSYVYIPFTCYLKGTSIVPLNIEPYFYDQHENYTTFAVARQDNFPQFTTPDYIKGIDFTFNVPFTLIDDLNAVTNKRKITGRGVHVGYLRMGESTWVARFNVIGVTSLLEGFTSDSKTALFTDYTTLVYYDTWFSEGKLNYHSRGTFSDLYYNDDVEWLTSADITRTLNYANGDLERYTLESRMYPYIQPSIYSSKDEVPFVFTRKCANFSITTIAKGEGAIHALQCVDGTATALYNGNLSKKSLPPSGEIPYVGTALQSFKTNNLNQWNAELSAFNRTQNFERTRDFVGVLKGAVEGSADLATGALLASTTGGALGASELASGMSSMRGGVSNFIWNEAERGLEKRNFTAIRSAKLNDLNSRAGTVFGSSASAYLDIDLQDRYKFKLDIAIPNRASQLYLFKCHIFGTYMPHFGEVLENCRWCFDYVQTSGVHFPRLLLDDFEREMVQAIFNNGVRKWHINQLSAPINYEYINDEVNIYG